VAPVTAPGPVRVAVLGATGRMGQSLVRAIDADPGFELVGALAPATSAALGRDAGSNAGLARPLGVAISAERAAVLARAEVALDFTLPEATRANIEACRARGCALLLGTTGLGAEACSALEAAASAIAVLIAPNTSLGVTVLAKLVAAAAAALPADYDIEVLDTHHRGKRDAPSGTARLLGEAAGAARGRPPAAAGEGRAGGRAPGSIGYASVRGGDVAGEHTVLYLGPGERLELSHRAYDRAIFARGALRAAAWLKGRPPGRYAMADVLGLG
jgi:4-hydroxy-tetrahydrodipicolinate reductase